LKELFLLSPTVEFSSWNDLTEKRKLSRENISEGIMLSEKIRNTKSEERKVTGGNGKLIPIRLMQF